LLGDNIKIHWVLTLNFFELCVEEAFQICIFSSGALRGFQIVGTNVLKLQSSKQRTTWTMFVGQGSFY
jgi:hypothetical protein